MLFRSDEGNPLRQVIVNTHSPEVLAQVPEDCLLIAGHRKQSRDGRWFRGLTFGILSGTWRQGSGAEIIGPGPLLSYLGPFLPADDDMPEHRVIDRKDLQMLLPFGERVE